MKRELEIEECEDVLDLDQIGHSDFLILKPCYITRLQESGSSSNHLKALSQTHPDKEC